MKHEIIQTENYLLIVDDSEIKEGDWILETLNRVLFKVKVEGNNYSNSSFKKVIAHLPLNGATVLKGVDLLLKIEEGVIIVEKNDKSKKTYSEEEVLKSADYLGFKQITSKELNSLSYQPFITDEDGNIWIIDKDKWFKQFKKKQ